MPATETIKDKSKQIAGKATRKGMIKAVATCFGSYACVAILAILIIFFTLFIILYIVQQSEKGSATNNNTAGCGFDQSKLSLYEDTSKPAVAINQLLTAEAKNYAINTLKIPESEMKNPGEDAMITMIREEVANQWSKITDKHGSTQMDAEKQILYYGETENAGLGHFNPDNTVFCDCEPEYSCETATSCIDGKLATLQPLSVTCGKYNNSYNQQVAAFYDQKYEIYLGVKEWMGDFQGASGEGAERWKNVWNIVFSGQEPTQAAINKVNSVVTADYKCEQGPGPNGALNVPYLSQFVECLRAEGRGYYGCAFTSTAMVLRYYGSSWDQCQTQTEMGGPHGNTPGNSMRVISAQTGRSANYIDSGNFLDIAKQSIARKDPVLTGTSPPFAHSSAGHVVVIVGFTPEGNPIVHDPNNSNPGPYIERRCQPYSVADRNQFQAAIRYIVIVN